MKQLLLSLPLMVVFCAGAYFGSRPEESAAQPSRVQEQRPKEIIAPVSFAMHDSGFEDALDEADLFQRELSLTFALSKADRRQCRQLFLQHQSDSHLRKLIAARWAELDPQNLAAFLEGPGKLWRRDSGVREALFMEWTSQNPDAAYAYASAVEHPDVRGEFLREVFGNLLYIDREKVNELVGNETDRALLYVRGTFEESLFADPEAAGAFVQDMPDSLFRMHAAQLLAKRWAQVDPEKAVAFAEQVEPNSRDYMVALALSGWMRSDPEAVRDYLDESDDLKGTYALDIGASLASYLGKNDPVETYKWVDENLHGKARAYALGRLVQASAENQPEAAAAIATDLPAGSVRSESIKTVAREWFSSDANAALKWAQDLPNPTLRKSVSEGIESSNLPREERAALQAALTAQRPSRQ